MTRKCLTAVSNAENLADTTDVTVPKIEEFKEEISRKRGKRDKEKEKLFHMDASG